jgi:hypothetical protein
MVAVAESLHLLFETGGIAIRKIDLGAAGKALAQRFGFVLEIPAESIFFVLDIGPGGDQRDKGDSQDQRNNQTYT